MSGLINRLVKTFDFVGRLESEIEKRNILPCATSCSRTDSDPVFGFVAKDMEAPQHDTLLLLSLIWAPLHAEHQEPSDAPIPFSAFQTKMG